MNTSTASIHGLVGELRDSLRQRRSARTTRRALEHGLATYRTPAEVNDLLSLIEDEEGTDADLVRDILHRQLGRTRDLGTQVAFAPRSSTLVQGALV